MQVQNSKITAPPRSLPSLKEEIRGERRPPGWKPSASEIREDRVLVFGRHPASPTFRALLADVSWFNPACRIWSSTATRAVRSSPAAASETTHDLLAHHLAY